MANWYGASRSNYFTVKDAKAFKDAISELDLEVWEDKEHPCLFGIAAGYGTDGYWPSREGEDGIDAEIWDVVAPHLIDGSIAVFQTAGAEKLRYVSACSVAIDNTGRTVIVDIDDIYRKAEDAFGFEPTAAQY